MPERSLSGKWLLWAVLVAGGGLAVARLLSDTSAAVVAVRVILATMIVAVAPGALVTLMWRPRPALGLLHVLGLGSVISFGLIQLLTVGMLGFHIGAPAASALLAGACLAAAGAQLGKTPAVTLTIGAAEAVVVVAPCLALGVVLYLQGSPLVSFEDQVHAALATRLTHLTDPSIRNVYFAPGVTYTYPFPGTHVLVALVANLANLDTLFVYHKLRFFWGPLAITLLYLLADVVFGRPTVAAAVALTGIVLVASGMFAIVPDTFWAQLVPFSHPGDIAAGVLLPGLLVCAASFLHAGARRERWFYAAASVTLVLTVAMVHVREAIQFFTYLGAFVAVAAGVRSCRRYARDAAILIAAALPVVAAYLWWHHHAVPTVAGLVGAQRDKLMSAALVEPMRGLLVEPAWRRLDDFFFSFDETFFGLLPFLLFTGPVVLVAFRHRPLVRLLAASTLLHLVVMTVPAAAFAYLYATYYEMLFVPVRQIALFVYLTAGASVALLAVRLAVWRSAWRAAMAIALLGAIAGVSSLLVNRSINHDEVGFFLPLVAAYAMALALVARDSAAAPSRAARAGAAALAGVALVCLLPNRLPEAPSDSVNVRWDQSVDLATRTALERRFSLTDGGDTGDPSTRSYKLADTSTANIRTLVQEPRVIDTYHIDRGSFSLERAPWTEAPGRALMTWAALSVWLVGFAIPLAWVMTPSQDASRGELEPSGLRVLVLGGVFLLAFAPWTWNRASSPFGLAPMPPFGRLNTPSALFYSAECATRERMMAPFTDGDLAGGPLILTNVVSCLPSRALVAWIRTTLAPAAVFAINRWSDTMLPMFTPQQVVVFPGFEPAFAGEQAMFPVYYRHYHRSVRAYREQPFFNVVETDAERDAFVADLGITHVVVDPVYYRRLKPVLDARPETFRSRFDDGRWAVYEVHRPRPIVRVLPAHDTARAEAARRRS